jgi:hypothetical protein
VVPERNWKYLVDACAFGRAHQRDRRAELHGQLRRVDLAAATFQIVGHIENHERGQTQAQHRRGQHQVATQVGRIQNQQHRVGSRQVLHFSESTSCVTRSSSVRGVRL